MAKELEPAPSYDPEVEKARIEAYKATQEGWQRVATSVTEAFRNYAMRSKEIEQRSFWAILGVMLVLFIGVGLLTWQGILPAEGLIFLVGVMVGYLVSLSPLARPTAR